MKGLEIHLRLNTCFSISVDKIGNHSRKTAKAILESYLSASAKEEVDIRADPVQDKADEEIGEDIIDIDEEEIEGPADN